MGLQALARVMEKSGRPKQLIVCPKPQAAVQVNRLPRYPKAMMENISPLPPRMGAGTLH